VLQKGCRFSHITVQEIPGGVVPQNRSKFLDSSHRVDQLYHGLLAGSDDYGQLLLIAKMVLLLSHGCG